MSKPFIKWAGGKRQLLPVIDSNLPKDLGVTITRYCEPFIGGGAVLFHLLEKFKFEEIYIGDTNRGLAYTYTSIKNHCDALVKELSVFQDEYYKLGTLELKKKYYLERRDDYNELISDMIENHSHVKIASHFIFLNKTGFNGMYRVNKKGKFNIPFGKHMNPLILDEINLRSVSQSLSQVSINISTYQESEKWIDDKTFVYLDPPYRPLTTSASFNAYTMDGFNDQDQKDLSNWVKINSERGAKIMLSNSDPKNVDENDNFFDDIYSFANIQRVSAKRNINSDATKRGKINEILITTY